MSFPLGYRTLPSGGTNARGGDEVERWGIIEDARITLLEDQIKSSTQRQQSLEATVEGLRNELIEVLDYRENLQRRLKESLTAQQSLANQLAGLLGHCATFPFRPPNDPKQETITVEAVKPLLNIGKTAMICGTPHLWCATYRYTSLTAKQSV